MNKNTEGTLCLQQFLPYQLFVLASRISHSLAKHYEEQFQITRPEWRIIAVLGETPERSAAEVAERTAMDKVAVSRAVTKLLKNGILQRHFSTDDRRRSVLHLSDEGKRIYHKVVPIALEYEQKILQKLDESEITSLRRLIEKLDKLNLDF